MPEIITLAASPPMKWIVILIAIDVILGIIAALKRREFRLGKLANFMVKPVLGYILGFAVLERVLKPWPSLYWLLTGALICIVLALIGSILNNLGKLGLSLPSYLKKG